MDTVCIGIIGAGSRARGAVRASLIHVEGVRVTALCDKFETLVGAMAEELEPHVGGLLPCHTEHREILDDPDIDAVYIAVEPENNAALVVESLEAGKHVICDVPLALTMEDCWRIVLAVERTGCAFTLGEQSRYQPSTRAMKKIIDEGRVGKVLFVEGQYLHGVTEDRFWMDPVTGRKLTLEEAEDHPNPRKSRFWFLRHPIFYLPHELSPILHILEDRVVRVTCMATRNPSYVYDDFPMSDVELALMHTEKDTILRLAAGFTVPTVMPNHWYHIFGTQGRLETRRYQGEKDKMWFHESMMPQPAEVDWGWTVYDPNREARTSGHGGTDWYPFNDFVQSIRTGGPSQMDVYRAADTAAPAILAGESAETGSPCLEVPDFRPGPHRKAGEAPGDVG